MTSNDKAWVEAARMNGGTPGWAWQLRDALQGEGEHVDPATAVVLWKEFSGDFCAQWMVPDGMSMNKFAAWLIRKYAMGGKS